MKKKIILLGSIITLALGLASCDNKPVDEEKNTTEYVEPASTTKKTTPAVSTTPVESTIEPTIEVKIPNMDPIPQDNATFDEYMANLYVDLYVGDDAEFWNQLAVDPINFGYERSEDYVPEFYSYDYESLYDTQELFEELETALAELQGFDYYNLTDIQKSSYDIVYFSFYKLDQYANPANEFEYIIGCSYVDQFGGYVENFASLLENYTIRNEQDVLDMISYTVSVPEAFASYTTYVADRAEKGYALSDYTLDEMIKYLDEITEDGTDFYLFELVGNMIDKSSLNEEFKTEKKEELLTDLETCFLPAVSKLSEDLEQYKGLLDDSKVGYWAQYGAKAQQFYKWKTENLLGYYDLDMNSYMKELNTALVTYKKLYQAAINEYKSATSAIQSIFYGLYDSETFLYDSTDPDKIIEDLKVYAQTLVSDLETTPEISFKYMDESAAKRTTTVAYYSLSALDDFSSEKITLNPEYLSDNPDETYFTIAHEGYPGHLYNFVLNKQNGLCSIAMISDCTGFGEGWAKYVEYKLYDYEANAEGTNEGVKIYCDYSKYWSVYSYLLYTRIDFGISYQGWDVSDVKKYFSKNGLNEDAGEDVFNQLIEMPTQYCTYGYGQYLFVKLHNDAATKLGDKYNEIEFNDYILSFGQCQLEKLTEKVNEYIAAKLAE